MALSGIRDVDMKIIDKLDDKELIKVCQVNKYVKSLCDNEMFWLNRIIRIYPASGEEVSQMKEYLLFSNYKELYIWLRKEIGEIGRDFEEFKKNLKLNVYFEKIIDQLSKNWDFESWINKKEFLIYCKRLLFKILLIRNNRIYNANVERIHDTFYGNLQPILKDLEDILRYEMKIYFDEE